MKKLSWVTETRKISDLVPNVKNPRTISPKQIEDLKKSLKKFNVVEIPVIDTHNNVIAGHQRLMVLKLLGRENETIEVRVPNRKLSQSEYDQYLLTSNRVHGDWDWDALSKYFDMDTLSLSGFDDLDLSKIFDVHTETKVDNFDEVKELKKIKKTNIKIGDIYQLGKHRLICGDATDLNTVTKLMDGAKVDMINQDPPFNINLSYDKGVGGKKSGKEYGGTVDDNKSDSEYKNFLKSMLENGLSVCKPNCHVFYWCDETYVWLLQTLYKELGISNKRLCIWIKNNASPTPQVAFNKATEFCVYGTKGSPYLSKNFQSFNEIINNDMTTGNALVDEIQDHLNTWVMKRLPISEYNHPTQKNPELHHKAIKRCTKVNDVVLDLTAGSGSIMSACEVLKRKAYMCEREPIFCQLIINRFKQLSHEEVRKIN
jgi:DNA modification methylase